MRILLFRSYRDDLALLLGESADSTQLTSSVADMVKRFQQESSRGPFEPAHATIAERPRSAASGRRRDRNHDADGSDSDLALKARPRLRRGRTEQPPARYREMSKVGLLSDGDRSYAAYASRIPSVHGRTSVGGSIDARISRSRPATAPSSPPRSRQASPERDSGAGPSDGGGSKPRMLGKGRALRPLDVPGRSSSPGLLRTGVKRGFGSSRVTSIARHFDRLSAEADRQRARRNAASRGKRARPVGATKAKVQVFDNVRDAFRDESDSASSEADNEEDDLGSDDSAGSGNNGQLGGPGRSRRKSSPVKQAELLPLTATTSTESLDVPVKPSVSIETVSSSAGGIPISASGSSMNAPSIFSDGRSEMSFTDRLQIELPTFETSAPLPSVPVTPQLSADAGAGTADEGSKEGVSQMGQMSESEMSSGGERSSILKTLTGLWAFRAGEYTPLEYPMLVYRATDIALLTL